jgi:uncharacterized protein (TIGR02231 family)
MNNRLVLFLLLTGLVFTCTPSVSAVDVSDSKISSVIVYTDRAVVTRTTKISLSKGDSTVVFKNMPPLLQDDSIRVTASNKKIQLGDIRVKPFYSYQDTDVKVKQLKSEIEDLQNKSNTLSDETDVINTRIEFLQSIKITVPDQISKELYAGKVNLESSKSMYDFVTQELTKCKVRSREITVEQRQLADKIEAKRRELNLIQSVRGKETKSIEIEVINDGPETGEQDISMTYHICGVVFEPIYEVRSDPDSGKIEITYFAQVSQATGEDWVDTNYTISTGKPAAGAQVGDLTPWYLDWYQPVPVYRKAKSMELRATMSADGSSAAGSSVEEEIEPELMQAEAPAPPPSEAVQTGSSVMFKVTGKHTVENGKTAKKLMLLKENLPVEFTYVSIPKKIQQMFITGKFVNSTEYPLLPGLINFYMGEDFVGKGMMDLTVPGEEKNLQLGIDQNIKIERKLTKFKKYPGTKRERIDFEYTIIVNNVKTKPAVMELFDQLPVSRNKEITVKDVKCTPEPQETTEQGIVKWAGTIVPKTKSEYKIEFTVEYPAKGRISGIY